MNELELKYGCNPNQKPARIFMEEGELPIQVLNGKPGYINFLDAFNSWQLVKELKEATGLPIVTEIMSTDNVEMFEMCVDVIQVGARNMQNFDLLKQLGKTSKPILLKRGLSSTIEEWLMSAEYIMAGGNHRVILCERGIRTFETYTRNTLDLSAVLAVKQLSHLPVVVDPSHACGKAWMVERMSLCLLYTSDAADD